MYSPKLVMSLSVSGTPLSFAINAKGRGTKDIHVLAVVGWFVGFGFGFVCVLYLLLLGSLREPSGVSR